MLVIIGSLLGASLGALRARKRGGNKLDMLQYGAVYAIIFALIGLASTIAVHRLAS
ncbi:hypothetical protein [Tritonibacter aquimaris]|uniref:hypothetical protein n=1 Tax=Tritonibacter aquimaris TaxID=2663379 RepID=UPI001885EBD7|nr:hypothetical protein [Tritonibacter aquimaris]